MALSNRIKNQHLLWRAGFGPMAENASRLDNISPPELWQLLIKTSSQRPEGIYVADNLFDGLYKGVMDIAQLQKEGSESEMKKEQRKKIREQSREGLKNLNLLWIDEMINSKAQLREKMSMFWHGHFACRVINSFFQQELLHMIRENALGNFGDMLRAVSKSPSMLQFLNNQQNKKSHPNENFAREVMELFTMGRGNYSEADVKEAARAFSGWGFNMQGEFVFRKFQHDNGQKTFLGKTGNFNGDDILDILIERKETASFITRKVCRYFVNESLGSEDEQMVKLLADKFYASNYDIKTLLSGIYESDWFFSEKHIGTKIKSPVELLAGIRRFLPMELDNDNAQLLFQKVLGQVLFFPPNVAGWPGGKSWIDSSTLMVRLQLPQVLMAKETLSISPKADDDLEMGKMDQMKMKRNKLYVERGGSAEIEWNKVIKNFDEIPRAELAGKIADTLLQTGSRISGNVLDKYARNDSREDFIKTSILNIMSSPEYQLC